MFKVIIINFIYVGLNIIALYTVHLGYRFKDKSLFLMSGFILIVLWIFVICVMFSK